jgi:hypothetical protein
MAQLLQERDHGRQVVPKYTFITCHYIFPQPTVSSYTFTTTQIKSATQNYNYSEMSWSENLKV